MVDRSVKSKFALPNLDVAGPFSGDKILWHREELEKLTTGEVPTPITVELDLTNVCNLDCPYCTNAEYRQTSVVSLSTSLASMTLSSMKLIGVKAVTFTGGGEPLCHRGASTLIQKAYELGMDVALITNGVLLNEEHCDLEKIVRSCQWIRISVDAHDRESYIVSKGKDRFGEVLANICRIVTVRDSLRSDCTIGVGYLTHAKNLSTVNSAARLFESTGVDYLQFRPMTFVEGDPRSKKFMGNRGTVRQFQKLKSYETDDYKIYASVPKYEDDVVQERISERSYDICTGVFFSCVVGATGDVWICCHMRGMSEFSIGNIKKRSLAEIWSDVATRNMVYERIGDFSKCMPLCRFHGQNKLLGRINWKPKHVNFL